MEVSASVAANSDGDNTDERCHIEKFHDFGGF